MPTQYIATNSIGAGVRITAAASTDYVILPGATVASTDNDAISRLDGAVTIQVAGVLIGDVRAVYVTVPSGTAPSSINVSESGLISTTSITAIRADGVGGLAITNRGEISGTIIYNGTSFLNLQNYGSITVAGSGNLLTAAGVYADAASHVAIYNEGTISSYAQTGLAGSMFLSENIDVVVNRGIIYGDISLNGGNDRYEGPGSVVGIIVGGSGNDVIVTGDGEDNLDGGSDDDLLRGNGGVDRLEGRAGNDTLFFDAEDLRFGVVSGGAGYDTGHYTDDATPITIRLQNHGLEGYYGSAADEVVITGSLGGVGAFIFTGAGNDLVDASSQADTINGGAGVDVLYGRDGADTLIGGLGGDWLQGGAGADVFRYTALTDSTTNGQDFIADFSTADGDKINLDLALEDVGPVTFNTGYGTGTSVYVFGGGGGTSLVQVYTGVTLQMQIVVSQAGLVQSDFVL